MEESNLPDGEKIVHNVKSNKILFLYISQPASLPVGIEYKNINELENIDLTLYSHILVQDLLDLYDDNQIRTLLASINNKMSNGSKLEIQGIDFKQICVAIANQDIDEELGKNIICNRKNVYNIYDIEKYLIESNYTVVLKRYINIFEYNIVAEK